MKILIVDDMFFSLQHSLVKSGHTVYVLINDSIPPNKFLVSPYTAEQKKRIHHVRDTSIVYDIEFDLVIAGTQHDYPYYEWFLANKKSVQLRWGKTYRLMGYSQATLMLERDRSTAFNFNNTLKLDRLGLHNPDQRAFTNPNLASKFLRDSKKNWVVKQHKDSPQDRDVNRTVLSCQQTKKSVAAMIQQNSETNPWFSISDNICVGGVVLEQRMEGLEVSFGAFFNGNKFVGDYYFYEEHKGALEGNVGGLLTGEVGTTMRYIPWNPTSRISKILRALESELTTLGCCGMIDINCILDKDDKLWFIEYTIRFGRPTLEMQQAIYKSDLATVFCAMCDDKEQKKNNPNYGQAIGVTVFTYGIPLVQESDIYYPMNLPSGVKTVNEMIKGKGVYQLFCKYNDDEWKAHHGDRQFICVAISEGYYYSSGKDRVGPITDARDKVYSMLENYQTNQLIFRKDIGANTSNLYSQLLSANII